MLFSDSLQPYDGVLSNEVDIAIIAISQYFGIETPKVLTLNEWRIVVPVVYTVPLPTMGAVNGVDIRKEEPMLIELSLKHYPYIPPSILSDRKDFPRNRLPHLYLTRADNPAKLCLVRNSPQEWFASIKIEDLLDVGKQWLYKAATGQLIEDGAEFDPIRVEGNLGADHIYRYSLLNDVVSKNERFVSDLPLALFAGGQILNGEGLYTYQTNVHVPFIVFKEVLKAMKAASDEKTPKDANPIFTFVFWEEGDRIDDSYLIEPPKNYGELKAFFTSRGIDLHNILVKMDQLGAILRLGVPIVFAMKRPCKMIGYDGSFEFLNFVLTIDAKGLKTSTDLCPVASQNHIEPFSKDMAVHLSGKGLTQPTLYIGCGSLGSKLILHDARGGNLEMLICDDDKFLPHNLARHELFSESLGENKAEALVNIIKKFYPSDNTTKVTASKTNAIMLDKEYKQYDRIIDTTASFQVMNFMVKKGLPETSQYIRAEVADQGTLGLVYVEGCNRNPRADDLFYFACFFSIENSWLRAWRQNDAKREIKTLNVGLGCSSTTSVVSDENLSFHASVFSKILERLDKSMSQRTKGMLGISVIGEEDDFPVSSIDYVEVPAFHILECQAGSGWEVRVWGTVIDDLIKNCQNSSPNETGGVLIGVANYKLRSIYIFDIIAEPEGSVGSYCEFVRGIGNLPEDIERIKNITGDIIGYIGEWHTHPMNLKELSGKDKDTISQLRIINRQTPIPTCALIVTVEEVLAFIYE